MYLLKVKHTHFTTTTVHIHFNLALVHNIGDGVYFQQHARHVEVDQYHDVDFIKPGFHEIDLAF